MRHQSRSARGAAAGATGRGRVSAKTNAISQRRQHLLKTNSAGSTAAPPRPPEQPLTHWGHACAKCGRSNPHRPPALCGLVHHTVASAGGRTTLHAQTFFRRPAEATFCIPSKLQFRNRPESRTWPFRPDRSRNYRPSFIPRCGNRHGPFTSFRPEFRRTNSMTYV